MLVLIFKSLTGGPGSGRSTQAKRIIQQFPQVALVSMVNEFRQKNGEEPLENTSGENLTRKVMEI